MICCWTLGIGFSIVAIVGWIFTKKNKIDVKGKVVMIVGASSGIGEACAQVFYEEGCKLILCARRLGELERIQNDLIQTKTQAPQPTIMALDITKFESITDIIQSCSKMHGGIDIIINNSGISYRGKVVDTSLQVDQSLMDVNYFGHIVIVKSLLKEMIEKRSGHFVFVSSLQGKLSIPYRSAYAASKHALQGFADCLRSEVDKYNVRVTVISPAYVKTKLSLNALTSDGSLHGVMDDNQKSGMDPLEVASAILESVTAQKNEVLLAKFFYRVTVYLRNICPNVYFYFISKKAKD